MIKTAVLTVSDRSSAGTRPDLSGPALVERLNELGWEVTVSKLIPDEQTIIQSTLMELCTSSQIDLILTTGGTGFSPRDVTPEATLAVIERNAPGLTEWMRAESAKINLHASLSRAVAGIRGTTLIINLPGSPKGAVENLNFIVHLLPHAISLLRSDPEAEAGHAVH